MRGWYNLVVQNGVTQWNAIFTRSVQDWEMEIEMVLSFFARLYSILVRHGEDDRLVWSLSKMGLFEVESYYEVLRAFLVASPNFTSQNSKKSLFSILVSHFFKAPHFK
jgi:hypothetical protein